MPKSFINISGKSQSNKVTRKDVSMGQVFQVKGENNAKRYAHVGTGSVPPSKAVHYRSINLDSGEEASSHNGDSEVTIIGTWELQVDLHEDFV